MAKVIIIFGATCLAILCMAVTASSFRTTVTIADDNPRGQISQRCQQQMQMAQNLRSCDEYLRQSSKFTEEILMNQQGGDWRQSFPRCCEQLEEMQEEECRCEGLTQVIHQEQQMGELQGRERRESFKTAQSLPGLCRVPPHQCNIPSSTLF